jgi:DNA topoisomerase-6 subunit B
LYGSKFHRLRQSRGIMGLGISGSVLYSQLTTGKPVKITTSTGEKIHVFGLMIDVAKNEPRIVSHLEQENPEKWHGVEIEMDVEGRYTEGAQSIPEYIKQTAISNPYAKITYKGPNGKVTFSRTVKDLPVIPKEIKPHPYGVELGVLERMLLATNAGSAVNFLMTDFSRVGKKSAETICKLAKIEPHKSPKDLTAEESERLHDAMQKAKLMAPPTDCLSPLTENLIEAGLKKEIKAEHFVATLRSPCVYRGYPFQISVGLAYGGELPDNATCQLLRFANRIPLIYHQGDCAITQAVSEIKWSDYGLRQGSGTLPVGPLSILVHFASVWVPFTTEGKQAIASYPEIIKEVKLALQDAGRKLSKYIVKKRKEREKFERRQLFERYIPVVAESLSKLTKKDKKVISDKLEEFLKNRIEVKKLAGSEEGT